MHFHLPKPIHGWRAFAGEVGIIVVGILIALSLEQIVSTLHDRATAAEARSIIRGEIELNLKTMVLRSETEPCLRARLREIAAFLDATERGLKPTPLRWVGAPFAPLLSHTGFQSAQSAGTTFLLPQAEQQQIAALYLDFNDFNESNTREWYDWAQLRTLVSAQAELSAPEITRLRSALQDAGAAGSLVRMDIAYAMAEAREYGLKLPRKRTDPKKIASVCLPAATPYEEAVKLARYNGVPFSE